MQVKATVKRFDPEEKVIAVELEFIPATEAEHEQAKFLTVAEDGDEQQRAFGVNFPAIQYWPAAKPNPDHLAATVVILGKSPVTAVTPTLSEELAATPSEADLEPDPLKE